MLSDAGHADGVKLTITTAGSYLDLGQYAQLIKAQCKPAGIDVGINLVSATQFYGGDADKTPWLQADMTIVEWSPRPVAAQYIQAMLTASSVWNSSHWANAEFDSLFGQYSATVDEASRSAIATKMGTTQQDETTKSSSRSGWTACAPRAPGSTTSRGLRPIWISYARG